MSSDHAMLAEKSAEQLQGGGPPPSPRRGYRIGQIIADKYRVERVIGEGAMGIVLAATHLGLDEMVAIKFIRADLQAVPGTLSRFAREAKIAARIRSGHVVKVLDVGKSESIGPYIVMEYLEGQGLGSVGDARGRIPVPRAAEYVLQACEALAAAHRIGVTHRDIKPDNLFLTSQGSLEVIKLLDFGISKASLTGHVFGDDLALTKTSHVLGTPMYMSPEQIRAARQVDHRTDIWSIGAVLYELITGRTAFTAESVTEICANILESPTPLIVDSCPEAPRELQALLDRCLQKDPGKRFQTIAELAHALAPLAPRSARVYAEHSSSILRGSSFDLSAYLPGSEPGTNGFTDHDEPAAHRDSSPLSADELTLARIALPRHQRMIWGLALAGLAIALGLWFVAKLEHRNSVVIEATRPSSPRAFPITPFAETAHPISQPAPLGALNSSLVQSAHSLSVSPVQQTPRLVETRLSSSATSAPVPNSALNHSPAPRARKSRRTNLSPSRSAPHAMHSGAKAQSPLAAPSTTESPPRKITLVGDPPSTGVAPVRRIRLVSDAPETQ